MREDMEGQIGKIDKLNQPTSPLFIRKEIFAHSLITATLLPTIASLLEVFSSNIKIFRFEILLCNITMCNLPKMLNKKKRLLIK